MRFFLLFLLVGLAAWGLSLRQVRMAIAAVPGRIWLAGGLALVVATALFVIAYSGDAIRLF